MPLINLQTNLKSFKYGHDRPGGGDSGQPYIQNNINDPSLIIRNNQDDGLIRGGILGATRASVTDLKRITKFITTSPQGPLFIARQVGLQLSNPKLETKKISLGRSGIFGLIANIANRITNAVGPTRIYNLGLNTLAQVPVNAFGTHFNRHGLLPVQNEDTKYESVVRNNAGLINNNVDDAIRNNRLLTLYDKLEIGQDQRGITSLRLVNQLFRRQQQTRRQTASLFNKIQKKAAQAIRNLPPALTTSSPLGSPSGIPGSIFPITPPLGSVSIGPIKVSIPKLNILRSTITKLSNKTLLIDRYIGGPGSVYGIGQTTIRRYDFTGQPPFNSTLDYAGLTRDSNNNPVEIKIGDTTDFYISTLTDSQLSPDTFDLNTGVGLNPNVSDLSSVVFGAANSPKNIPVDYFNALGVSEQYYSNVSDSGIDHYTPTQKPTFLDQTTYAGGAFDTSGKLTVTTYDIATTPKTYNPAIPPAINIPITNASYAAYKTIIDSKRLTQQPINIVSGSTSIPANQFGIFATDPTTGRTLSSRDYSSTPLPGKKIAYINSYGDVTTVKISGNGSWADIAREKRIGSGRQDEINLTPIFKEDKYYGDDKITINKITHNIRDLVRFRIQAIDTDNPDQGQWMAFRAYLTDLSDDSSSEWTDIKYAGRGEKFYVYTGFTRKINISFKVAALSVDEMKFIYQKLNFLMGNTMPDYSGVLMRGPLTRMSVGNWIDSQIGILNSVNFKVPQDSPWEINLDGPEGGTKQLVLPHIVEVSLSFTPIGSETNGNNLISEKSTTTSHIAQNNTGPAPRLQYIQ